MTRVVWYFSVQYTFDLCKKSKIYHDGTLHYFPANCKAVLIDVDGNEVESIVPVQAGGLIPDGRVDLERTAVTIITRLETDATVVKIRDAPYQSEASEVSEKVSRPIPPANAIQNEILYTTDKSKKIKKWKDGWMSLQNGLATFYSDEDRHLHSKKVNSPTEVMEGIMLETFSYLIEITARLEGIRCRPSTDATEDNQEPADSRKTHPSGSEMRSTRTEGIGRRPSIEVTEQNQEPVDSGNIGASGPEMRFEIMYTKDKTRKSKRWKDGTLEWQPSTGEARFSDEDSKTIFRRKLNNKDLTEGNEVSTAVYLFQIGSTLSSVAIEGGTETDMESKSVSMDNEHVLSNSGSMPARNKPLSIGGRPMPVDSSVTKDTAQKSRGLVGRSSTILLALLLIFRD